MGRRNINPELTSNLNATKEPSQRAKLICDFFLKYGNSSYDASVTQSQHALQTATLAMESDASRSLTVSSFLHDLGHLLLDEHMGKNAFLDKNLRHENVVIRVLRAHLSKQVLEPIRLHVSAKRYLCAIDPSYYLKLSDNTKKSLNLQGGPMTAEEQRTFETHCYYQDAVKLRHWDDAAKQPGRKTPDMAYFERLLSLEILEHDSRFL